jgi:hypothetical protein
MRDMNEVFDCIERNNIIPVPVIYSMFPAERIEHPIEQNGSIQHGQQDCKTFVAS